MTPIEHLQRTHATPPEGLESRQKTVEAARDFEGLMMSELLRAAHLSDSAAWTGAEDSAADSALGLAQEQLARSLASGGGMGIARMVIQGLDSTHSNTATPARKPD